MGDESRAELQKVMHEGSFGNDGHVHFLNCGDGFMCRDVQTHDVVQFKYVHVTGISIISLYLIKFFEEEKRICSSLIFNI